MERSNAYDPTNLSLVGCDITTGNQVKITYLALRYEIQKSCQNELNMVSLSLLQKKLVELNIISRGFAQFMIRIIHCGENW